MREQERFDLLVTGGAGFVGFHLCKHLLGEGHRVICLDDLSTGVREHVDVLQADERFEFVHHDVTEPVELRVDRIFNLACPASPPDYQADPIRTTRINVVGVMNMLELAEANRSRLLQASTSEVYGDPAVNPQPESYRGNVATMGPRACYDEGKRCAECLIHDYHRGRGVDVRVARIFNTYGPGMRENDGRVVSNFIVEALQGRDITVYGDGLNTRSLCFVDDLVEGLLRLMGSSLGFNGPVNLGNPRELTVLDLARLVIELTGSRSEIVHFPEAVDDPHRRCPDIAKARTELHWEPTVALRDGLEATIEYFRARLPEIPAASGPRATAATT